MCEKTFLKELFWLLFEFFQEDIGLVIFCDASGTCYGVALMKEGKAIAYSFVN